MSYDERTAQLEKENSELKAALETANLCIKGLEGNLAAAEKEHERLESELSAFHAAMEREKKPDWEKWLKDLADGIDTYVLNVGHAARQLRYMADSFTLKANFVPSELRIKELEKQLAQSESSAAAMRGVLHLAKEMSQPGYHANPYRGLEHTHFDLHAAINNALSTTAGTDLLAKLERYEKALTFYSDSKRWEKCYAVGGICDSIEDGDPMMVFLDGEDHPWSVAREALGEQK